MQISELWSAGEVKIWVWKFERDGLAESHPGGQFESFPPFQSFSLPFRIADWHVDLERKVLRAVLRFAIWSKMILSIILKLFFEFTIFLLVETFDIALNYFLLKCFRDRDFSTFNLS